MTLTFTVEELGVVFYSKQLLEHFRLLNQKWVSKNVED